VGESISVCVSQKTASQSGASKNPSDTRSTFAQKYAAIFLVARNFTLCVGAKSRAVKGEKRKGGGKGGGKVASGNVKLATRSDLFARHRRSQRI